MNILDKFTNNLKKAIQQANALACELECNQILPLHLLYSLALQKGSMASEILTRSKVNPRYIKKFLTDKEVSFSPKSTPLTNRYLILSLKAKKALEKAVLAANLYQHKYIGSEHLLSGLLRSDSAEIKKILLQSQVNLKTLNENLITSLKSTSRFPDLTEFMSTLKEEAARERISKNIPSATSALDFFATCLTNNEVQAKIDPVVGRSQEIARLIQILARRTKNNPILLGDTGVGKTAIVEGLAKKILHGEVPDILINKKIYSLDLSLLVAGTMFRGEFESRLKAIIDEIKQNPQIILFIDELHTIMGAGSASGSLDVANILKPALARGEIRCIGATTYEEYKKHIEQDRALERRFQIVKIEEPTTENCIEILQGLKDAYEKYHQIKITPAAIRAAVQLSTKFLPEKFLPDKAIDLIDEAASSLKVRLKKDKTLREIKTLEEELTLTKIQKQKTVIQENFSQAVAYKEKERKINYILSQLYKKQRVKNTKFLGEITEKEIANIISRMTGIPLEDLIQEERERLVSLEKILSEKIKGQEKVIKTISDFIRRSRCNLAPQTRPLASFIFLGPSGVGKTELAKVLAETLFQEKEALVRLDMSEFAEGFNLSRLIGAPAGYVGYREGGKLTEAVRRKPYSVILFDEIEKAHPEVINILLQILEEGVLSDAEGRRVNFKNAIIIMTSNIGLKSLNKTPIGFGEFLKKEQEEGIYQQIKNQVLKELESYFPPEFLNRVDKTLVFRPLGLKNIEEIVKLQLKELNERLKERNLTLEATDQALKYLAKISYSPKEGARSVRKTIQEIVENHLAQMLLAGEFKKEKIKIETKNKKLVWEDQ